LETWCGSRPGNETRFSYDEAGRRIARIDPDLGAASFAYDGLGQLVAQLDARGTYTQLSYDALGRLVRREGDGPTTTWTWDRADHGVGKLARVETVDGAFAREERYDAYGRSLATTTRIGRDPFEQARTYDAQGRVASLRYPTGFAIVCGCKTPRGVRGVADESPAGARRTAPDGHVVRERLGQARDGSHLRSMHRSDQRSRRSAGLTRHSELRYAGLRGILSGATTTSRRAQTSYDTSTVPVQRALPPGDGVRLRRQNLAYKTRVGSYLYRRQEA
jgi:YD repeat-containing protein